MNYLISNINDLGTTEKILILICSIFVAIIIILIIVSLCLATRKRKSILRNDMQNTRIYIINAKSKTIVYFDKHKVNEVKSIPLFKFFEQFDLKNTTIVENWIKSLINDPDNAKSFLETHIKVSKNNKTEFVLLEATSVEPNEKIIHLESHLLPQLSTSSSKHNGQRFLLSYEVMQAKFNEATVQNRRRGVGCLIHLYFKQSVMNLTTKYSLGALTIQSINLLSSYLNERRCACLTDVNEIFIFDDTVVNRSQFFSLANQIIKKINGYLVINSMDDEYGVCIGAAMLDKESTNMKVFLSHCRDMVIFAERDKETGVALYEENSSKVLSSTVAAHKELTGLIHNRSFRYYFTPIISSTKAQIYAYMLSISPYGTSFKDFASVLKEATSRNLLASIYDIVINDFRKTAKENELVLFHISLEFLDVILSKTRDAKNKNMVLLLDQEQMILFNDKMAELKDKLERVKACGYSIGISFESVPTATLSNKLIKMFDLILLTGKLSEDIEKNKRAQADLRLMKQIYKSYEIPIIIYGLDTIASAEVALTNGIDYFSCTEICNASSVFELLGKRHVKLIREMNKKLN